MKISSVFKTAASLVMVGATAFSLAACGSSTSGTSPSPSAGTGSPASSAPTASADNTKYSDTITVVWYPNESASDFDGARKHYEDLIAQATGKKVIEKTTTDYNIAIEALASGQAQIGALMGAQGFIQAQQENAAVKPLVVNSGASGTLDDAIYYSWLSVNKGEEQNYMKDGKYAIDNIQGKRISFVSNSSTSGFKIPTTNIISHFSKLDQWKDLNSDDLAEGGANKFFSEVLFGGSHQGSAVNLLTGKADVGAFCDTELVNYAAPVSGDNTSAGSVWEVKKDATAPFDTLTGKQFVIIQATPVLNGPSAYNAETLSPADVKAIQDLMTSDKIANDPLVFVPKDSSDKGFYKKSDKEQFVVVEDSWYDPIRALQNN
ncbi:phosphonate transport system substrate-binding protein [Sporobacter termitidis DSM 10068]|uniref:Phosphonate transport system substrate-binding protein n=1 Tax=Sporobacter termitidis DSM 10068 TaxID=1123282 RepID=A0A1M5Z7H5_9FIRM|nr:PhnD/SsuA/transferrin family substrate-binding protein [Sporobacter termitidis]SHI20180.1 phosphonate transport system substrate-binding protein [Sporobacter termitidis DSM 10068]